MNEFKKVSVEDVIDLMEEKAGLAISIGDTLPFADKDNQLQSVPVVMVHSYPYKDVVSTDDVFYHKTKKVMFMYYPRFIKYLGKAMGKTFSTEFSFLLNDDDHVSALLLKEV